MQQTSISAWLNKPAAIKEPPPPEAKEQPPAPPAATTTHETAPSPAPPITAQPQTHHEKPSEEPPAPSTLSSETVSPTTITTTPVFLASKPRPLIANIRLEPCTSSTLAAFTRLNTLLLPIPYPPKFYNEILTSATDSSLTLLAIWSHDAPPSSTTPCDANNINTTSSSPAQASRVIGGIRCRLLGPPNKPMLYISTLAVLSSFRSYGVATHLLHRVLATAVASHGVREVGAHVWVASADARRWYAKRGFREVRVESGYYRRLSPHDAVVLRREVGVTDLLAW